MMNSTLLAEVEIDKDVSREKVDREKIINLNLDTRLDQERL
jgi:hypothetical protein